MSIPFILFFFWCWYLVTRAPFWHLKFSKLFGDLCWFIYGPLECCFIFFSLCHVFLHYMFNLRTITVKCESIMQCIFSFLSKKTIWKGKQKERHKKYYYSSIKNPNLVNLFFGARIKNITFFGFVQYLPMTELKIFVNKCSLTLESGNYRKKKNEKEKNKLLTI